MEIDPYLSIAEKINASNSLDKLNDDLYHRKNVELIDNELNLVPELFGSMMPITS